MLREKDAAAAAAAALSDRWAVRQEPGAEGASGAGPNLALSQGGGLSFPLLQSDLSSSI